MDSIGEESDVVGSLGVSPTKAGKASHRRVWSVGVGGAIELDKLKKEQEVDILHNKLEKQSKALEESQEETQLAARIGQTLLLQKQQLDYELEDKLSTLTQRCEEAEAQVQALEGKYQAATQQCRQLDQLRVQHEVEIEELANKTSATTSALKTLKDELTHARNKAAEASADHTHLTTEVDELKKRVVELKQVNSKLTSDFGAANAQVAELRDVNQELESRVAEVNERLRIALASAGEYDSLQAQHAAAVESLNESLATNSALQEENRAQSQQIATLGLELHQATDRLELERTMAQELLRKHDEWMHKASSGHSRAPSDFNFSTSANVNSSVSGLKQGSLFHELSLQLAHDVGPLQDQVAALKEALACATIDHSTKLATLQTEMQNLVHSRHEALAKAADMKGQLATATQSAQEWEQKCMVQTRELDLAHRQLEHAAIELADTLKQTVELRDKLAKADQVHGLALQQHSREMRSLQAKYQYLQTQYADHVAKWKTFVAHKPDDGGASESAEKDAALEPKYRALLANFHALQTNHEGIVEQLESTTSRMHAAESTVQEQLHQLATLHEDVQQLTELWNEAKVTTEALQQRNEELYVELHQTASPTKKRSASEVHRRSLLERGSLFHELTAHVEQEVEIAKATTAVDLTSELEQVRALYDAERAKVDQLEAAAQRKDGAAQASVELFQARAKYQRKASRVAELEALLDYTQPPRHSIFTPRPTKATVSGKKGHLRDFPWDLQLKPIPVLKFTDMHAIAGTQRILQ